MDSSPLIGTWKRDEDEIQTHGKEEDGSELTGTTNHTDAISIPAESVDDNLQKEQEEQEPAALLHRSWWALVLVTAYSSLAIFAWSILCILSHRPLTTKHYGSYYDFKHWRNIQAVYNSNEGWLRTARVIQGFVSVVTIPLTSAVCTKAAVVFTQRQRKRRKLSLRQMVTLADRGWTSPVVYSQLFMGKVARYGSSLLYIAIFLNLLGGVLSPLQFVFLKISSTKTPTSIQTVTKIPDVLDLLGPRGIRTGDINLMSILTRSAITTTSSTDPQPRLWTRGQRMCNASTDVYGYSVPSTCKLGSITLDDMKQLIDPFSAHLPSQFNTGLTKQFIPRMNSSATRDIITAPDFPDECESRPGAFYVGFNQPGAITSGNLAGNWSLSACMPANLSSSPWRPTRDRQDITEQLFLNVSVTSADFNSRKQAGLYRITLNSTLGYFELPNYANGQKAGPLLTKSPWNVTCTFSKFSGQKPDLSDCYAPGTVQPPLEAGHYLRRDVNSDVSGMSRSSVSLQGIPNKGPLLLIAMAMFGPSSFIASRVQHPEIYVQNFGTYNSSDRDLYAQYCVEQSPMMGLLAGSDINSSIAGKSGLYPGCVRGSITSTDMLHRQIENWIMAFINGFASARIVNAFESAAFLASEVWLVRGASDPSLTVSYDLGADSEIPLISLTGIITISVLLSLFLGGLFAAAFYASAKPVWTFELDSFAMMRIGAALHDEVPFKVSKNTDRVHFLDEAPGWVGDGSGGQGPIGHLELGAQTSLTGERKVYCYKDT